MTNDNSFIIDTHCHIDNKRFKDDIDDVIKNAMSSGIKAFLIPGASFDDLEEAIRLSEKYNYVFFSIGIHPYDCENFDIEIFKKYASHPKCIAIGECGLDYFRLPKNENEKNNLIEKQKNIFIEQIEFAKKVNKPIIVHIRDASTDSKEILVNHDAKIVGGVLHCFNADKELLELSNHNFYFGIGGIVTFKNAKELVDIVPKIPIDKIILETDCPYLAPTPYRGKRNEPKYIVEVSKKVSDILNIDVEKLISITTTNAKKLFKRFDTIY